MPGLLPLCTRALFPSSSIYATPVDRFNDFPGFSAHNPMPTLKSDQQTQRGLYVEQLDLPPWEAD